MLVPERKKALQLQQSVLVPLVHLTRLAARNGKHCACAQGASTYAYHGAGRASDRRPGCEPLDNMVAAHVASYRGRQVGQPQTVKGKLALPSDLHNAHQNLSFAYRPALNMDQRQVESCCAQIAGSS